jgi:hypothetical protein
MWKLISTKRMSCPMLQMYAAVHQLELLVEGLKLGIGSRACARQMRATLR